MTTPPTQKPEKKPAVSPLSTLSDAPPSRLAVTTSRTWRDDVEVKTLVTSGMTAPARVPQVMIVASFHHRCPSPPTPWSSHALERYVPTIEIPLASQTSRVRGAS